MFSDDFKIGYSISVLLSLSGFKQICLLYIREFGQNIQLSFISTQVFLKIEFNELNIK